MKEQAVVCTWKISVAWDASLLSVEGVNNLKSMNRCYLYSN